LAGGGEGGPRKGASSPVTALEGGRRAKTEFGNGFCLPSGARAIFPMWRAVSALPIGSCCAGAGAGAPALYLGSNGRDTILDLPVVH
jgi:hypothetical protein